MVNKVLDALRATVVSPEVAILGLFLLLWIYRPSALEAVGARIQGDDRLWQWLLGAPAAILVWDLIQARHVLFPVAAGEARKSLRLWPDYWRLKLRVALSLLWGLGAAVMAVAVWIFHKDIPASVIGGASLAAIAVAAISAGTLYWASIGVRERVAK